MKNIKHQGCITLVEESIERNGRERLKKPISPEFWVYAFEI